MLGEKEDIRVHIHEMCKGLVEYGKQNINLFPVGSGGRHWYNEYPSLQLKQEQLNDIPCYVTFLAKTSGLILDLNANPIYITRDSGNGRVSGVGFTWYLPEHNRLGLQVRFFTDNDCRYSLDSYKITTPITKDRLKLRSIKQKKNQQKTHREKIAGKFDLISATSAVEDKVKWSRTSDRYATGVSTHRHSSEVTIYTEGGSNSRKKYGYPNVYRLEIKSLPPHKITKMLEVLALDDEEFDIGKD